MKNIILILSIIFLFSSCKKDKNEGIMKQEEQTVIGAWYLTKVEGGFSPVNNFTDEIKWTFSNDNTISVVIEEGTLIQNNNNIPFINEGIYSYSQNDSTIVLANDDNYYYELSNNNLILKTSKQGIADDGTMITFTKQ